MDVHRFTTGIDSAKVKKKYDLYGKSVIFALRAHEAKYGIEHLIESIPHVVKEEKDVVFVIGGGGSLREYHQKLTKMLIVDRHIRFTGQYTS